MRLPIEWLQQYVHINVAPEVLAERLTMAGLEVEAVEQDAMGAVLDVTVTPNRGDCLSIVGIAREVAAAWALDCAFPAPPSSQGDAVSHRCSVQVEAPDACPRYAARIIDGLQIGPSPDWMQRRLEAAGMRPINNVVDVTNYVMLELGQPLHAFDLRTLPEGRIVVRRARPSETLRTLDGIDRVLDTDMLMICDASRPVAVAGVMGGESTEVSSDTRSILLESASFHRGSVRATSRKLGLATEASYRFERQVDAAGVVRALDRACELLAQIGAGTPAPGVVDVDNRGEAAIPRELTLNPDFCRMLLGMEIEPEQMAESLRRLQFDAELRDGLVWCQVPSWRSDVTMEHDLVEEVGRVTGYEHIPERLPSGVTCPGRDSDRALAVQRIRDICLRQGMTECHTDTLRAPGILDAPNTAPITIRSVHSADLSTLRTSLLPCLGDVVRHNLSRRQGELRLFEVGTVYRGTPSGPEQPLQLAMMITGQHQPRNWDDQPPAADFYTIKAVVESLFVSVGLDGLKWNRADDPRFHPGRSAVVSLPNGPLLGVVGELHPEVMARLDIKRRTLLAAEFDADALLNLCGEAGAFRRLSRYPAVLRDVSLLCPDAVTYGTVRDYADRLLGHLLESLTVIDVYRGERLEAGHYSLTLSMVFRAPDRTLTDTEIDTAIQAYIAALNELEVTLRS